MLRKKNCAIVPSLQWAKIGELDAMQFDERPSKVEHLEVICDFPDTFQCHESKIVEDPTRARRLNCDRVVVAYAFDGRRAPLLDKFG